MISSPGSSHTRKPNMGHERIDIGQPDPTFTEDWLPYRSVIRYAIGGGWGNETLETGTGTVRIIRGTDFKNIHNRNLQGVPLRYETSRKISSRQLEDGDVILEISGGSRTSNQFTGRSFFVSQNLIDLLGGVVIPASFCRLVRFDEDRVAPKYAYYALQNMYLTGRAALYEQQSTGISNFQFEYFLDEEILRVPPLPEQQRIAGILGALDDKIELNRRMNETLEQMARALYKSWFVDFDPVRAKMDRRWKRGESLPGLPAELYDLFPDHLLPSKLGDIPEGWSVGTVDDLVTIVRDNEDPAENPEAVYSHFSIPAYDDEQRPKRELGSSIKSVKSRVPTGVVLLSKLNPHIERVWLVDVGPDETAVCSTEFLVLKAKPPIQRCYVYCLAVSPTFRQLLESLVTGTSKSHQRAPAKAILSLEVLLPAAPVIEAFESYAGRVLNRSLTSIKESDYLARQRDAVLPKLISGELRVHDTCGSFGLEEPESTSTHHIVSTS